MPETVPYSPGWLRVIRPRIGVPPAARATFLAVTPIVVAGWALTGFYLSLGPSLTASLTGGDDRLVAGLPLAAIFGAGAIGSLLTPHWTAARAVLVGAPLFVVGTGLTIAAVGVDQFWLYLVGSAIAGLGFGPSFAGSLRALAPLVGLTERGELLTAVYVTSYLGFSVPALAAGVLTTHIGLRATANGYAAVIVALALIATVAYARRAGADRTAEDHRQRAVPDRRARRRAGRPAERLDRTRWPVAVDGIGGDRGTDPAFLRALLACCGRRFRPARRAAAVIAAAEVPDLFAGDLRAFADL